MFEIDIEICDHCGGAVKVIASIERLGRRTVSESKLLLIKLYRVFILWIAFEKCHGLRS